MSLDYIFISEQEKIVFINNNNYLRSFFLFGQKSKDIAGQLKRLIGGKIKLSYFDFYRNMNKLNLSWILKDL